ncbi:MAG: hypothetical protein Q7S87_00980 [Agitococcus sp.]|nr:hypothetical protein [Agitococcus sp.]MDO9179101.1 hypothetical protein [Agitococcus sp.]
MANPSTDIAVMRLAHPLRIPAAMPTFTSYFEQILGPRAWSDLCTALQTSDTLTGGLIEQLCNRPDFAIFKQLILAASSAPGGTELGNAYAILVAIRQAVSPQPYFVLDDPVVTLLEHTDIADDIPISMLQLPYSRFFIEFGKSRETTLRVQNIESGSHIVEGCYCERGSHSLLGPGFYVVVTGSPLGKADAMDDATNHLFLATSDPDLSIKSALHQSLILANKLSTAANLRPTSLDMSEESFDTLLFLAKALLYLGLASTRRTVNDEKKDWRKAIAGLKSPAKKLKAEKRARGLVDHILISAPPLPYSTELVASGTSVKAHWRRGHYRMQAHGLQSLERKLIFVSPMLINADTHLVPSASQYLVK